MSNNLHLSIGDTVHVNLKHDSKNSSFDAVISKIITRWGKHRGNLIIGKMVNPVKCW
jgi:hypothetical protein